VPSIQDYFNDRFLQHMQETFSTVVGMPVRLCRADGRLLFTEALRDAAERQATLTVPVRVADDLIGQLVVLEPKGKSELTGRAHWAADFLKLMGAMLTSLCTRQRSLRLRMEELSTMYRLTAEFTGQRDLQAVLDTITQTVVTLLEVQACTIRLLTDDGEHLAIKSANNIDDSHLIQGPIPLVHSRIDHEAIRSGKMVYVPDLGNDPRVLFPQGARAEGLVSCLAAPLIYKGETVGVIRMFSGDEHKFDRYEQALFNAVAGQAAAAIVDARLQEEAVTAANIKRQLRLAGDVQQRMFPSQTPQPPGMTIADAYIPCFELGGDFYDYIQLDDDRLGFVVCDVVGKGVRASLLMASIRSSLRAHAANTDDMSEVIARVNADLCEMTEVADFATLFYGVVDSRTRKVTYVNAGHPAALLFRDGRVVPLISSGGVVGVEEEWGWEEQELILQAGDLLFLHSDGLIEAMNFADEAFGQDRTELAVQEAIEAGQAPEGLIQHVIWRMRNFAGLQTRVDDLTIVAIQVE
jgi:phosphoserine phosphatase RsbU/P